MDMPTVRRGIWENSVAEPQAHRLRIMKTHKRNKDSRTTGGAARSSVQRDVRALAKELWAAGVAEVRKREGWSDRKTWRDTSERTRDGMMGIAKYVKNWKRPND